VRSYRGESSNNKRPTKAINAPTPDHQRTSLGKHRHTAEFVVVYL
jgi:hypothetical protein